MKRIWQRLSKREKGLVFLTLFVFFLVLGRYFLLGPFLERREWVRGQLEIQPQLLEKNLRYVSQKTDIAAALDKARGELRSIEPFLLSGDTPSVSASDLQQAVQALAAKEGVQIISTRVLNPEAMGTFTKIPIQVEVGGQIDQVANVVKGIESGDKLLVLSELNIRSLFSPVMAGRQPPVPQMAQQNLRASLTISGFARSQAPSPVKSETTPTKGRPEEAKAPGKSPTLR